MKPRGVFFVLVAVIAVLTGRAAMAEDVPVVGWIEHVELGPEAFMMKAKLDTGADSSSINASGFAESQRNGKRWVRFTLTNFRGQSVVLERQVVKTVRVKRHGGESLRRPVIVLNICLGTMRKEARFSLTDRSRFKYQVLIGRSFLSGVAKIDSGRTYTIEPRCNKAS